MLESVSLFLDASPFVAAFVIGLLGGAHCIGMCGGVMSALSFSVGPQESGKRLLILLSYNIGRISSYVFIGVIAGVLGSQLGEGHGLSIMRVIAGLLLIAMGLYIAGWWQGLRYLEKLGSVLWRQLQPLSAKLLPVKSPVAAVMLGAVWGWLPCGLIYTALAYAIVQASIVESAGVMLAFGLGTLPAVLLAGVMAERVKALIQQRGFRSVMAVMIMLFGAWTIWGTYQHVGMDHSQMSQGEMNHPEVDHGQMNQDEVDRSEMDHSQMNKDEVDHSQMDHSQMNH